MRAATPLYELHTGRELARTCLGNGVSMGIHESQSRFYENIIGRSRAFCSVLLPWLKEHFPAQLEDVTEEQFYRMVNRSRPLSDPHRGRRAHLLPAHHGSL